AEKIPVKAATAKDVKTPKADRRRAPTPDKNIRAPDKNIRENPTSDFSPPQTGRNVSHASQSKFYDGRSYARVKRRRRIFLEIPNNTLLYCEPHLNTAHGARWGVSATPLDQPHSVGMERIERCLRNMKTSRSSE